MINKRIDFLLIVLILFAASSCKKESLRYPQVSIEKPQSNSQVKVLDTVVVKATVSDETLRAIEVTLVNQDFQPVTSSISVPVNSASESFTTYLPIDNVALETGIYKVRVRAWNDQISGSGFRDINVEGIPLERLGWYLLCSDSLNSNLYYLPNSGNRSLIRSGMGLPTGLAVNSQLRSVGISEAQMLEIIGTDNDNVNYSQSSVLRINNTLTLDNSIATLMNNGRVHLRDEDGNINGTLMLPTGYQPYFLSEFGEKIVVFSFLPSSGNKLTMFSKNTLLQISDQHIGNYKVDGAFQYNSDLYVLGNLNQKAYINKLSSSGSLTQIGASTNEMLLSGVIVNKWLYVALESEMMKIDLDINFTTTLNLNFNPSHMEFDPLSNEILMSEGINFRVMDHELNQIKRSVNLPSAIFKHYAHFSR